jgi:hypothetical protein
VHMKGLSSGVFSTVWAQSRRHPDYGLDMEVSWYCIWSCLAHAQTQSCWNCATMRSYSEQSRRRRIATIFILASHQFESTTSRAPLRTDTHLCHRLLPPLYAVHCIFRDSDRDNYQMTARPSARASDARRSISCSLRGSCHALRPPYTAQRETRSMHGSNDC